MDETWAATRQRGTWSDCVLLLTRQRGGPMLYMSPDTVKTARG
jgi:hypothetical protein